MIAISVNGANNHYNFPIGTTQNKNSLSELGVIFWGSPLFLAVLGLCHDRGIPTLNFGPISTKLGGTVRAIKKMTQKDNGPGPGAELRRNRRFYGMTVNFRPWERFSTFRSGVTAVSVKKFS